MRLTRTNLIHSFKTHCFNCVKQSYRLRVIFYLREFCSLDTNSIEFLMNWSNWCHKNVWIYYYYLTCVTFINDYDVEIWWNNQKSYLVKFRKLQNAALWKILSAFQTSSIDAMQIEVEISSMKIWLNQKCKNYAIWIVELLEKHSIRKRTFIMYSFQYSIELNLNLNASKYLNWNKMKMNVSWKVKKCKDRLMQIY